jgi:hypothetical protein
MKFRVLALVPLGTSTETAESAMKSCGFKCSRHSTDGIHYLLCREDQASETFHFVYRVLLHYSDAGENSGRITDIVARHDTYLH